jgi:N-acetyltransferase 10
MSLSFASHYKNSPNDLQLLSDAPAHALFVLLPPLSASEEAGKSLPDPLCVVQVAYEGKVNKAAIMEGLKRGLRSGGDMIPWIVASQFGEASFGEMSGARVVRIAVHPDYAHVCLSLYFLARRKELTRNA